MKNSNCFYKQYDPLPMEFKTLYQEAVRTNESHEIPFKDNMPNQIIVHRSAKNTLKLK